MLTRITPFPFRQPFSFLVIGNSITVHGCCEYWWGRWGMGASQREKDFVHLLATRLEEKYNVSFEIINLFQWETMYYDRAETLQLLDKFLDKKFDLIILQLGENISNVVTLKEDFFALINYVRAKISSTAEIVIIGQFWKNDSVDMIKRDICTATGCHFIDLHDIQNDPEYLVGIGREVFGDDGQKHIVVHEGVANHPGDKAMELLTNRIFDSLNGKV